MVFQNEKEGSKGQKPDWAQKVVKGLQEVGEGGGERGEEG